MAKKNDNDGESQIGRVKAQVNRGTQDELEILRLIVTQTPTVRTLVMDKLRTAKARHISRGEARSAIDKRQQKD